jgi:hypothetical protein
MYRKPWYESILDSSAFWVIATIILIALIYRAFNKRKGEYHSHWSNLVPSFKYSTEEFYKKLQVVIENNKIRGINIKIVEEEEGASFVSPSRKYLRVRYKEYSYYMCTAPFGEGLFLSWWLYSKKRKRELIIGAIPIIGPWLSHKLFPTTMYRIDTASMFMTYCHDAMKQVLDEITKDTGFRLSENDRKPTIKNVFKR